MINYFSCLSRQSNFIFLKYTLFTSYRIEITGTNYWRLLETVLTTGNMAAEHEI